MLENYADYQVIQGPEGRQDADDAFVVITHQIKLRPIFDRRPDSRGT